MAQIARTAKATDTAKDKAVSVVELGRRTAEQGADTAREMADQTEDMARRSAAAVKLALVQPAAAGTTKISRVFVDLANEQSRHNLETLQVLARTVAWDRVFEIQGAYLQASLERTARLTQRYLQLSQAIMGSAAAAAKHQANQAA